jgi:hypothetical protein
MSLWPHPAVKPELATSISKGYHGCRPTTMPLSRYVVRKFRRQSLYAQSSKVTCQCGWQLSCVRTIGPNRPTSAASLAGASCQTRLRSTAWADSFDFKFLASNSRQLNLGFCFPSILVENTGQCRPVHPRDRHRSSETVDQPPCTDIDWTLGCIASCNAICTMVCTSWVRTKVRVSRWRSWEQVEALSDGSLFPRLPCLNPLCQKQRTFTATQ